MIEYFYRYFSHIVNRKYSLGEKYAGNIVTFFRLEIFIRLFLCSDIPKHRFLNVLLRRSKTKKRGDPRKEKCISYLDIIFKDISLHILRMTVIPFFSYFKKYRDTQQNSKSF